jgi:hypothetical protein
MKKHLLLWKCVMVLSFHKPATTRRDFVRTEVLYYAGGTRSVRKVVSIFPSVFYYYFSITYGVTVFGIPWHVSQSKRIFSLKDPRLMRCSQKLNRILSHLYQVCTIISCF